MQIAQFDEYMKNPKSITQAKLWGEQIHCGAEIDIMPRHRTNSENSMVLTYTVTGINHLVTDDETYILKENTFCFRHPKMKYNLLFGNTKDNRRCYLKLPFEFFNLLEKTFPDISKLPVVFEPSQDYDVLSEFFALIVHINNTDNLRVYECFTHIFDFIFTVLKLAPNYDKSTITKSIHEVISNNFDTPLEELVSSFDVNYNTFRKEFTQMYGLSPARYRNNCRIEAAKRLLLSGHSCIEVASRLNYADVYTFSHRFKKEVLLSPTAFIKTKIDY